jgi:S-adenosylmethionine hydrolase
MSRPVIALLTDFGTRDHYAGAMKGVLLDICPEATLVDITHDIEPHDVTGAALELAAACRHFPAGTVFLVVVDPGVGSARRGLAATAGQHQFVAPDNGVLAPTLAALGEPRVVELASRKYTRPTVSRTFEGRERFGPAAAWLATGVSLTALGPGVTDWLGLRLPEPAVLDEVLEGEVMRVDRFGNLVTNIDRALFECFVRAGGIDLEVGGHPVEAVVQTYAEAGPDVVVALFGSAETLEVALNGGSAAARLQLARGAPVRARHR